MWALNDPVPGSEVDRVEALAVAISSEVFDGPPGLFMPAPALLDRVFRGAVRRARPGELEPMNLPDDVCRVVAALGAPVGCGDYFAAEPWDFLDAGPRPSGSSSRLRMFGAGWNDTTAFCLDGETPTVYGVVVEDGRIVDELYVNRDYATFMAFLCHVRVLFDIYEQVTIEAYLRAVPVVQDHLARLDQDALVDGAWWVGLVGEFDMV